MTTLQLRHRPDWRWLAVAVLLALMWILSGCSGSRHVVKTSTTSEQTVAATSETRKNTEDRTVTTHTEHADTTVLFPGVKVQTESSGVQTQIVVNDDTLSARYDPVRNVIRAQFTSKPRTTTVKVNKQTTVQANVSQQVVQRTDSTATVKTTTTVKDKTTRHNWIWFGLGGLVLFGVLAYLFYRWLKTRILF